MCTYFTYLIDLQSKARLQINLQTLVLTNCPINTSCEYISKSKINKESVKPGIKNSFHLFNAYDNNYNYRPGKILLTHRSLINLVLKTVLYFK